MVKKISSLVFITVLLIVNGIAQEKSVVKETGQLEKPSLAYGIVVDNSGSYRMIFETVIKSVNQIIDANGTDDETFLVRFVDTNKIALIQDFTSSKDELRSEAESMFIEGGQTAILDGVYFSAKHLADKEILPGTRKLLILITDGEDRKSAAKIEDVLKFLKNEKIQVYTLGLSDGKIYKGLLEKLAKETGGKSFMVEKRSEIGTIIKQLTVPFALGKSFK
jgi:Ca-activated chloride channel homolog